MSIETVKSDRRSQNNQPAATNYAEQIEKQLVELVNEFGPLSYDEVCSKTGLGKWRILRYVEESSVLITRRLHRPTAAQPYRKIRVVTTINHCSKCGSKIHD